MATETKDHVLVLNGEIYNHNSLRASLRANGVLTWHSNSDTETLLKAISNWGIDKTLSQVIGMYAFATWDSSTSTLILARDRMGEKPLYFGVIGSDFVFGSELKALKAHPKWRGEINGQAVSDYFTYGYVPSPLSIYNNIFKLLPGHILKVNARAAQRGAKLPEQEPYWSLRNVALDAARNPFQGSELEAAAELERRLSTAVASQLLADVGVGALLSGGIDSSTVVALMAARDVGVTKTFTIGFHESEYDETSHARVVANYLGTEHHEFIVTAQDAFNAIPELSTIYDEPFADSSQIPTYLVSKLARQHVTVALSGDGGDELFAGYNRYLWATRINRVNAWAPKGARAVVSKWLCGRPGKIAIRAYDVLKPLFPKRAQHSAIGDRLPKFASALGARDVEQIYSIAAQHWPEPPLRNGSKPRDLWAAAQPEAVSSDSVEQMSLVDTCSYLPDDILVKVDRASMASSLETRAPFLDHRVVDLALRLPINMKICGPQQKRILRSVLFRHIPAEYFERPKMGFALPLSDWLRGPLREWADQLLSFKRINEAGVVDPGMVQKVWQEHLAGTRNWHAQLWVVLMFQAWVEREQRVAV
jgi:asparagine synthase (glutamine-hydrolysing)